MERDLASTILTLQELAVVVKVSPFKAILQFRDIQIKDLK